MNPFEQLATLKHTRLQCLLAEQRVFDDEGLNFPRSSYFSVLPLELIYAIADSTMDVPAIKTFLAIGGISLRGAARYQVCLMHIPA